MSEFARSRGTLTYELHPTFITRLLKGIANVEQSIVVKIEKYRLVVVVYKAQKEESKFEQRVGCFSHSQQACSFAL
jgi:hypothetical protein